MIIDMHEYLLFLVDQIKMKPNERDVWIIELDEFITEEVGDKLWTVDTDWESTIHDAHVLFNDWIADYYDRGKK